MACPVGYRLGAAALRDAPALRCHTLYAAGGLYGNLRALAAIRERAAREVSPPLLVFNGDFNFLNASPAWWREVNGEIRGGERHVATAGNVEVEAAAPNPSGNGCGCSYPEYVSRGVVRRSDAIVAALRAAAADAAAPELCEWLRALPTALVAEVGPRRRRVGIVHGDVESLSGWRLGVEAMPPADEPLRTALGCGDASGAPLPTTPITTLLGWFADARVGGILSSHTCLPFGQVLRAADGAGGGADGAGGELAVFNNGSAGMPNFAGRRHGVLTRVSADPTRPADSLYGAAAGGLRYDALPVPYAHDTWMRDFDGRWPDGSDAHVSYRERMVHGPSGYTLAHAARDGVS